MWSHIFYVLVFTVQGVYTEVIITAYDGIAISLQQPLTLTCNYTRAPSDFIIAFNWYHDDTLIATGTFSPRTVLFQPSSQWNTGVFLGDFVSSLTIQLPAPSVTPTAAGNYTCKLSAMFGGVQDSATATILESQKLSGFPSVYKLIELSRLHLDCSSYINQDTPTSAGFTWTHEGDVLSSSPNLSISRSGVQRSEAGEYTCTVNSTTGVASGTVTLVIQYKPHISGQNATYPIPELSPLEIDCSSYTAAGNPSNTSFIWTGPAGYSSAGSLLSIRRMSRSQTGRYTCTASNTLTPTGGSMQTGTDTGQFNVIVQYMDIPSINLDKTEVMENESVTIGCSVNSSPRAELILRNVVDNPAITRQYTNSLQSTITNVNCLHNGSISCSAGNRETGAVLNASTELNVWCSPRLEHRQAFTSMVYSEIDEVVSLAVEVIANPACDFSWYKDEENLFAIPSSTEHTVTSDGLRSTLKVKPRTIHDYGSYAVVASNKYGRLQMALKLSQATCPVTQKVDGFWTGVGVGIVIVIPFVLGLIVALICVIRNHTASKMDDEKSPPETSKQSDSISNEIINIRL